MNAKVFGGPKYTVSPTYEGMLKEEMDAAAARHPDVPYEPQLIDATFAPARADRRAARDPGAEPRRRHPLRPRAAALRLDRGLGVDARRLRRGVRAAALMAEAAHGTAPSLFGKDVANPMAMILAGAACSPTRTSKARPPAGRSARRRSRRSPRASHRRSRRPRRLARVHRRGDPPHDPEARGLGLAVTSAGATVLRPTIGAIRDAVAARRGDLALPPAVDERLRQLRVELRAGAALELDERLPTVSAGR